MTLLRTNLTEHYGIISTPTTWRFSSTKSMRFLFLGICPPREHDDLRSSWPVIHYTSYLYRYPSDQDIDRFSKFAKVLEIHQWVWQSRYSKTASAYGETYDNSEEGVCPPWFDQSHLPQDDHWIPESEAELKRVINKCHQVGMLFVPYFGSSEMELGAIRSEAIRLKVQYHVDGLYLDGLTMNTQENPLDAYLVARDLRRIFGDEGWLNYHDTHSGYFAPFIQSYMDFITTSEHDSFNKWTSTTYNISNAIGGYWPEIAAHFPEPQDNIRDTIAFLKNLVDVSLPYRNRILFLAGDGGQWRFWRLYFNEEEVDFLKQYYLPKISGGSKEAKRTLMR
jgi:hypothetical protein